MSANTSPGTSAALAVRDLAFRYPGGAADAVALARISFSITSGSLVGLVGPNGAGKSTLLKLLSGFLTPDAGTIDWEGTPMRAWKRLALARRLAYVPQTAPTDIAFTALEVALAGRFPHVGYFGRESARDVDIARNALARLDAAHLADRRYAELSGGEQARVLVARALAQEPAILLLDEPTAFLDVGHRVDLYDRLREENRTRGLTVLVVTHDLNMASEYCDRLVLLSNGKVVADGPPAEVLTAERVSEVYACRVAIDRSPTNAIRVTPLPKHAP